MISNKILLRYFLRSDGLVFRYALSIKEKFYVVNKLTSPSETSRAFHTGHKLYKQNTDNKKNTLMTVVFENIEDKKKDSFLAILRTYKGTTERRGHIEFIILALKYMEVYGVHRDLESYKALLNILPKGPFVLKNFYQAILNYYPKHQETIISVLEQMEKNHVIPDREVEMILLNTFGKHAIPLKKLWRMLYWMPKFANLNPWPIPFPAPQDPKVLGRLAIQKISDVDATKVISEYETGDIEEAIEDTWIISSMSLNQKRLLNEHYKLRKDTPLYAEGPFNIWVGEHMVDYFMLRADPIERQTKYEDPDDVSNIKIPFWQTEEIAEPILVHEQEDGIYFAVCATGTSSKDSVVSWIRFLQRDNPVLENIPVLIKLKHSLETECIDFVKPETNVQTQVNN